jgi:hypothetical protein
MERMAWRSSIKFEHAVLCEKSAVTKKIGFFGTFQMPVDSSDGTSGGGMMVIACES